MEHTLSVILGKARDYKICKKCGLINWYENEKCHNCDSTEFEINKERIIEIIENEYELYKDEGYTESEIDEIVIDV